MLRHTAGVIAAGIGLMFVLWILSQFLPGPPSGWFGQEDIDKWIPFNAGSAIWENQANGLHPFSPWIGFAVFCCYAAVAIIGGLVVFLRPDACPGPPAQGQDQHPFHGGILPLGADPGAVCGPLPP